MDDTDVRQLLPLLAVDAVTDEEREEAEAMIGNRPDLRAELDQWRSVVAKMAEHERRDPPPSLRGRVLTAVAGVAQEAPEADPALQRPSAGATETMPLPPPSSSGLAAPVVPITAARSRRSKLLALAAAAVVVLGGAALLAAPLTGSDAGDEIAAIVEDEDAATVDLSGELGTLQVTYVDADGAAVLTGSGLPMPEGDRVYELWTVAEGDAPARVEIFRPDDEGDVELLVEEMDLDGTVLAITEEPAGGSDAPTGDIIASSS